MFPRRQNERNGKGCEPLTKTIRLSIWNNSWHFTSRSSQRLVSTDLRYLHRRGLPSAPRARDNAELVRLGGSAVSFHNDDHVLQHIDLADPQPFRRFR